MKNVGYFHIIRISLLYHDSYIIRCWQLIALSLDCNSPSGHLLLIDIYTSQSKYIVNL